jgi:tRNA(fMet)-specific endonuclease VapC
MRIIYPDLDTSHIYAAIASVLKGTGQLIQPNDMWIAALAQQHTLTVFTRDGNFKRDQGLSVEVI